MAKARPKQQHYVTKAYLDGFLGHNAGQLVCYARKGNPFTRRTQDLAKERNFYAFTNDKGEWDDSLEHLIERMVESPGLPVLQKLAKGNTRLNWNERTAIALLVAFQEVRTPASRQRVVEYTRAMTDKMLCDIRAANPAQETVDLIGKNGNRSTVTLAEIEESQADLEKENSFEKLRLSMGPAMDLYKFYKHMKFTMYYPFGQQKFVTTDTPVIRVYSRKGFGSGINRSDLEIRFPVSSDAFLTITHDLNFTELLVKASERNRARLLSRLPEVRTRYISDADVLSFNRGHVRHARMWVFSSHRSEWIPELLKQGSSAPKVVDLSSRDLYHFQSEVSYDPSIDAPDRK